MTNKLTVEQVDRDIAADILWRDGLHRRSCKVKDGHLDDNSIVQALAHHRQQAEAIAAWNTRALPATEALDRDECICPKCGIRHGGRNVKDPSW